MDNVLNISDVIEVLQTTDPQYLDPHMIPGTSTSSAMFGNNPAAPAAQQSNTMEQPYVVMLEQPAPKALRFRYECEGRSAGSIPGVNSTPENKTYPTIKVMNYQGRAVVVVSCVTKDVPYRPHPHNLVGKDGFKRGVCTLEIQPENMTCVFSNLGIQCVKKKDIEEALKVREEIRVDPYRTGFSHRSQPTSIDLNAVRLAFQVFLENPNEPGKFKRPLPPIVSDPIYDKKAMSDLVICRLSDVSCYASGGKEIILLCEKVAKEDISIRFYEEKDGQLEWEGMADFQPTDVHKQVAIGFRTPAYKDLQITKEVDVKIQLKRPSDNATSEPKSFKYLPLDSAINKRKQTACNTKFPPSKRSMPGPAGPTRAQPMAVPSPNLSMQNQPQPSPQMQYPQPLGIIKTEPGESFMLPTSTYQPTISPSLPAAGLLGQFVASQPPALAPLQSNASPQGNFSANTTFLQYTTTTTAGASTLYTTLQPMSANPNLITQQTQQQQQQQQNQQQQQQFQLFAANFNPSMPLGNLEQYDMAVGFSGELNNISLSGLLDHNLSENLSGRLNLSEVEPSRDDQEAPMNMSTDSITRFAVDTYDKLVEGATGSSH